jgi:cell division protein ZapA
MGQVAINLNGRFFRFDCGEGEEARFKVLAAYVKGRVEDLTREFGSVGEERLLLMAALYIADELLDARAEAAAAGNDSQPNTAQQTPLAHIVTPADNNDESGGASGNASS